MAVQIGPKIGIDGEKEYRNQINNIITTTKTLNSEMRALTSTFDKEGASVSQNKAQKELLNKQIDAQRQKVEQLTSMLEQSTAKYGENDNKTQKWAQAVNDATADLNKLEGELKALPSSLEIVGAKFESVGGKIKSVGDKITSVGQKMSTTITAPVLAAGAASVKFASDYEENLNKVDVAFSQNAEEVKAWAQNATTQFGLSQNAALEATSLFGDMATSMGITTGDAAEMSTTLAGLAGDLSSFKNVDIKQAMTALNGVFTGETESLKQLGIVMTQTNLEEFANKTGRVYTEMSQAEKVALRYEYVLANTQNAQGDYARTADGTANSMRTMQASLDNLAVAFGQQLLPSITPIINGITDLINKFGQLDEGTKKTIITVAGIAAVAGPLLVAIGSITSAIGGIVSGVGVLLPALAPIGAAIAGIASAAVAALPAVVSFLAPFAPFIAIGAAVVAAGVLIYKNWDTIKAKAQELGGAIAEKWESIKTKTAEVWGNVKSAIGGALDGIKQQASDRLGRVKQAFEQNGGGIKGVVSAGWQAIKEYYRLGFDGINALTGGKLGNIVNAFKEKFGNIKNSALSWGRDIIQGLINGIKSKISAVGSAVSEIASTIRSYLHFSEPDVGPLSDFHTYMPDFMNGLAQGMLSNIGKVENAAAQVAGAIAQPTSNVNNNYGGFTIVVNGAEGQDVNALAEAVADKINNQVMKGQITWA